MLFIVPLIAITYLSADAFDISILTGIGTIPWLLLSLVFGVFSDRVSQKTTLIFTDIARFFIAVLLFFLFLNTDVTLGMLAILLFLSSTAAVLFDVSYAAYIKTLEKPDNLGKFNGKCETFRMLGETFAPSLCGRLLVELGVDSIYLIIAVFFALSSIFILRTKPLYINIHNQPDDNVERKSFLSDLSAGIKFATRHNIIKIFTISGFFWGISNGLCQVLLVIYLKNDLELTTESIGLLLSCVGIGVFLGGIFSPKILRNDWLYHSLTLSIFVFIFCWILIVYFSAMDPGEIIYLLYAITIAQGITILIFKSAVATIRQLVTPHELMGRSMSVSYFLAYGTIPIASLLSATLVVFLSVQGVLLAGIIGMCLSGGYLIFSIRKYQNTCITSSVWET